MTETHEVHTEMMCRDCASEMEEYVVVNREDSSEKYVCPDCAK
jgi:hypothetical protein